ncbi:MAG: HEAT repeat domain-containing protein, partial [Proteobacteria bacterium]|nr:HEAT repeat domain-containing protein [Pseudomonadota bacterium]
MSLYGPQIERLEAIAAGRDLIAVAGRRDVKDVTETGIHVIPTTLLDGKGEGWTLPSPVAVHALVFAGDLLLLSGDEAGNVVAWDVTAKRQLATLNLGPASAVRAIAVDPNLARGDRGGLAVGTQGGKVAIIDVVFDGGTPRLTLTKTHALSDGAINAIVHDPAGVWLVGGNDGQLTVITPDGTARAITPGGDGGIRAIVAVGDGRAIIGCGDGSIRACFIVGAVEPTDRSGDNGHDGAVRGLALGPVVLDDAGRDQPRRLYSIGEDRALKLWFVDGARRPRTIENVVASPATAMVFAAGLVAKVEKSAGRLWITGTLGSISTQIIAADGEPFGDPVSIASNVTRMQLLLADANAATKVKLDAVASLAAIAEDVARKALDAALEAKQPAEVHVAIANAMARTRRRASRPVLRATLGAAVPEVRLAAFAALLELERDQPIAAIRPGLAASNDDLRLKALDALMPIGSGSVIARGLITDALKDRAHAVRRHAFGVLRQVVDRPMAIRTALAHGTPDVRAEALLYLAFVARITDADARTLTASAFDDDDAGVRTAAFLAAVFQRPRLAVRIAATSTAIAAAFKQVMTELGVGIALPPDDGKPLSDDELEPLFVALACRFPDAANRGAGGLLAVGDARAVGAVLQLTREADPSLRRGATTNLVAALARWPGDDRLLTRLHWLLDDGDTEVRAFAFDALARGATAAGVGAEIELAELALRTSQEDIRVRALQILVRVGAPGSTVAEHADVLLGDALDDEAPKVRSEAFRTLWTWHSADPMTPLRRGRASRHGDLRQQVVTEIERRRQAKQSTADMDKLVLELVKDPVGSVGLAAYGVLTKQLEPDAVVAIDPAIHLAAMQSPSALVRAAGATGCGVHKAPIATVRARLVELVKDDHPGVHIAAIEALDAVAGLTGTLDAEGFALAFASVFWNLQVRACELLGRRRDPRAVAPCQRILSYAKTDINRPPDDIRRRAAEALAITGDLKSLDFMRALVDEDDPYIKEMGARGIAINNVNAQSALEQCVDDAACRAAGAEHERALPADGLEAVEAQVGEKP